MSKKIHLKIVKTDGDYDEERVKGKSLFPELYSNIYISGRKKSGKTQLLFNILRYCAGKDTSVLLFGPTVRKDGTYKEISKMLDSKEIQYQMFESFIDNEGNDLLELFISSAGEKEEEDDEQEQKGKGYVAKEDAKIRFGDELPREQIAKQIKEDEEKEKKRAEKEKTKVKGKGKIAPEYIICFDDLGEDLRRKPVSQLLIKNRHYKAKVIILSQWLSYLSPTAIRQLDYCIIFGGFPEPKMNDLHMKLDIGLEYDKFYKMYEQVTAKKYNFLYIDCIEGTFRHNFNNVISGPV